MERVDCGAGEEFSGGCPLPILWCPEWVDVGSDDLGAVAERDPYSILGVAGDEPRRDDLAFALPYLA